MGIGAANESSIIAALKIDCAAADQNKHEKLVVKKLKIKRRSEDTKKSRN